MKRILAVLITLCVCLLPHAAAAEKADTLRVGLYYGSGALSAASVSNVDGAGFTIGCYNGRSFQSRTSISNTSLRVSASGGAVTVSDAKSGAALYTGSDSNLALRPNGSQAKCQDTAYRGDLVFAASGGALTVMNYVSLDDYAKGVLPYEMTPSWSLEALKAQAVCTRSYALGSLNKHQSRYGFDVCDTTDCQVYKGTSLSTTQSDSAVDATSGEYLTYNGEIATGYFSSSDGGATEDAVNVWGTEIAYLKGVPDPYEDLDNASNGRWKKTLSASEVASKLRSAGYSIGSVSNVAITKRTSMDNVNEVTVTDTSGSKVILKREACRTVFGLNSIRYSINGERGGDGTPVQTNTTVMTPTPSNSSTSASSSPAELPAPLPSSAPLDSSLPSTATTASSSGSYISGTSAAGPSPRFAVNLIGATGRALEQYLSNVYGAASSFTFAGTGWGHSVGMSQYGAKGMAEKGFSYQDILHYYFTDIQISK